MLARVARVARDDCVPTQSGRRPGALQAVASPHLVARRWAGHSKWANIKHKKGALDEQRGVLFTKLARLIETASRQCVGDLNNASLASAMSRGKDAKMPKAKIEAAVERGANPAIKATAVLDVVVYEGSMGGVSFVVEALTDNKSRTASDVKAIFRKGGGAMAVRRRAWRSTVSWYGRVLFEMGWLYVLLCQCRR
mmetsp:Transcript_29634/g.102486  ORF Transcript_29634/g.102486 Transcript_29634/m.102486 type:complete len:195 (-) Transcript_29634:454-1038(-)